MATDPAGNDTALIWNYRENTWTIRRQSNVRSGDIAPQHDAMTGALNPNILLPIFASGSEIIEADEPGIFTAGGGNYTSYIERKRFAMTPEFTTENLVSMVLLTEDGNTIDINESNPLDANLFIRVTGTDVPAQNTDLSMTGRSTATFNTAQDYKVDIREHGRLLNYRITDDGFDQDTGDRYWSITGHSLISEQEEHDDSCTPSYYWRSPTGFLDGSGYEPYQLRFLHTRYIRSLSRIARSTRSERCCWPRWIQ